MALDAKDCTIWGQRHTLHRGLIHVQNKTPALPWDSITLDRWPAYLMTILFQVKGHLQASAWDREAL